MHRYALPTAAVFFAISAFLACNAGTPEELPPGALPLVFDEGHDTDPVDRGRPVVLVAAALDVPPEVFREAFSHVRPAPAGTRPDPQQVRDNKSALMKALGKYGVTNERLDEVSNYYRYRRDQGELWPTAAAAGYALVTDGKVTRLVITRAGHGYSSAPKVTIRSLPEVRLQATLSFGKEFEKNGTVSALEEVAEKQ